MFGIYQNGIVPGAHNAWTAWADKVLEKKASLGFSKVALVSAAREHVLWYTGNFLPSLQEIKVIKRLFDDSTDSNSGPLASCNVDRITISGHTYMTRPIPGDAGAAPGGATSQTAVRQLVAFNGNKYVLISRSKTMYIVVLTEGRRGYAWLTDALDWLSKLCQVLIKKNY